MKCRYTNYIKNMKYCLVSFIVNTYYKYEIILKNLMYKLFIFLMKIDIIL